MKRYLLFAGDNYYPEGGWHDLKLESDDLESLKLFAETKNWNWMHIADTREFILMIWSPYVKGWV